MPLPRLLALALLASVATTPARADVQPCGLPVAMEDGWRVAPPQASGLDQAALCRLAARLEGPARPNVHAVLVVRGGKLAFERYFTGDDERWGRWLGTIAFGPDTIHDMRSVTKTVTALLVGAAIDRGLLAGVDEPVMKFFPEYADLRTPERDRILLRHLLTMTMGIAWDEERPYTDPSNSELQMSRTQDPLRYVLEQPVVAAPGEQYRYNGGATALLAAVVQRATGQSLEAFARSALFQPLGIAQVEWIRLRDGNPAAASGLRLRPRDLAKIGQMLLAGGTWAGRRVLSAEWVREVATPRIGGSGLYLYGYQVWLGRSFAGGTEIRWFAGVGLGGQRVFVVPDLDLVVVTNAGMYANAQQSTVALDILNRVVEAAVAAK
jgi:CubicO group peptidase (beta-lactamase class C family)